jgi:site-specific DNA recombinase
MRKAVEDGRAEVVLVYRLDRLSRNVRDVYDFIDLVQKQGVDFASISENFDTTTAMGRAMVGVAAVFAQLTREMIAENVRDGLARRAEAGKWNGPKWNPPIGYTYSVEQGELTPDPVGADIIRQIYRWFTVDKLGTYAIARRLNEAGVPKPTGTNTEWHQTGIWKLLDSPLYAGYIDTGDQVVRATHEPLIDKDTYRLAREIVKSRRKQGPRTKTSPNLLAGIPRCAGCDRKLVCQANEWEGQAGQVRKWSTFRHSPTEFVGAKKCEGAYVNAATLEEIVLATVRECAQSEELQEMTVESATEHMRANGTDPGQQLRELQAELGRLDAQFTRWADRLDAGLIDEKQFGQRNAQLMERRDHVQRRVAEIERELAEREALEVSVAEVKRVLTDLDALWEAMTFEERREMLRNVIEYVKVGKGFVVLKVLFLPERRVKAPRGGGRKKRSSRAPTP